ncbi:hypothetical protein, partial [Rhabdochromatium marinum]|uniref:hypothetical protein n=1 Tax=Rhabdochromatium marinum TaxID=48729 RepID=UPI001A9213F0
IGAVLGLGCTSKTTPFPDSCRPMPRADHLLKLLVLDRGMIKAEKEAITITKKAIIALKSIKIPNIFPSCK